MKLNKVPFPATLTPAIFIGKYFGLPNLGKGTNGLCSTNKYGCSAGSIFFTVPSNKIFFLKKCLGTSEGLLNLANYEKLNWNLF